MLQDEIYSKIFARNLRLCWNVDSHLTTVESEIIKKEKKRKRRVRLEGASIYMTFGVADRSRVTHTHKRNQEFARHTGKVSSHFFLLLLFPHLIFIYLFIFIPENKMIKKKKKIPLLFFSVW